MVVVGGRARWTLFIGDLTTTVERGAGSRGAPFCVRVVMVVSVGGHQLPQWGGGHVLCYVGTEPNRLPVLAWSVCMCACVGKGGGGDGGRCVPAERNRHRQKGGVQTWLQWDALHAPSVPPLLLLLLLPPVVARVAPDGRD